jgi:thiosulfate dehydrogenase [quinone] large subunit
MAASLTVRQTPSKWLRDRHVIARNALHAGYARALMKRSLSVGRVRRQPPQVQALPRTDQARWLWLRPPPAATALAGWALLPLRLFLGVTFCFAGLQKLANPSFFRASNPAGIQAQMVAASRRSPIHALLTPLAHHAVLIGTVIALGEVAVGVGALAGLFTRIAALGGALISLNLFLAVSFHTNPYYTGSDIVFIFAWLPLIVTGGGQFSADALIANLAAVRQSRPASVPVQLPFATVQNICGHYQGGWCVAQHDTPCAPAGCPFIEREVAKAAHIEAATNVDMDRRRLVGALTLGAGTVAVLGTGAIAGIGRLLHSSSPAAAAVPAVGPDPSGPASSATAATSSPTGGSPSASNAPTPSPTSTHATSAAAHPPGTKIGPASDVPVAGAATFGDPATGDPAIVLQPRAGTFLAFDAVCPHAGCTVEYDQGNGIFVCPCHGSQFNGSTGAVEVGPANQGLGKITIAKGSDGQLYAT